MTAHDVMYNSNPMQVDDSQEIPCGQPTAVADTLLDASDGGESVVPTGGATGSGLVRDDAGRVIESMLADAKSQAKAKAKTKVRKGKVPKAKAKAIAPAPSAEPDEPEANGAETGDVPEVMPAAEAKSKAISKTKARARPKAKAKAEAASAPEVGGDSEATAAAKASAKGRAKGKAKGKSKAKAQPKAKAKASAAPPVDGDNRLVAVDDQEEDADNEVHPCHFTKRVP